MEYYGLRKSGADIDLIADEQDIIELIKLYPDKVKDLSDLGVCPFEFEIWRTILLFNYDDLKVDAIEEEEVLVISLEKLLLMKALAMSNDKYLQDTELLSKKISDNQYLKFDQETNKVREVLSKFNNINYIEKTGPGDR